MSTAEAQTWIDARLRARPRDRGKERLFRALYGGAPARVRRSTALAIAPKGNRFHVTNFLDPQAFQCTRRILDVLASLEHWTDVDAVRDGLGRSLEGDRLIVQLVGFGAVLVEGTEYAAFEAEFRSHWAWGPSGGWLHFETRTIAWSTDEEIFDYIQELSEETESPPLFTTNEGLETVVSLPAPDVEHGVLRTMRARRSQREFCPERELGLTELTPILYSGLAITEFLDNGPFGTLPLSMTPSGGGRNPYEAYVLAARVGGLEPGLYHYSATEHSLGLVRGPPLPGASRFLADEEWVDGCAAVVFLVANFGRTMWKYRNAKAYNVVMIEAGHIAQNMLLTATELDLAAYPTAALRNESLEVALDLHPVRQAPLHAVVLAHRALRET